jgi:hypothetical protein
MFLVGDIMDTLTIGTQIAQISYTHKELSKIIQVSKTTSKDVLHGAFDRNLVRDECLFETSGLYGHILLFDHERDIIVIIKDIVASLPILAVSYFPFVFSRHIITKKVVRRRYKSGMYLLGFPLEQKLR